MRIYKPAEHIKISPWISEPYYSRLNQAKGVMENYMKDKNFDVVFNAPGACLKDTGDSVIEIMGHHHPKKGRKYALVEPDENMPFLRNVYKAIENITKEFAQK